jgi:hypothetical protein
MVKPILYISPDCIFSVALLNNIKSNGLWDEFAYINVSDPANRQYFPRGLRGVPTMYAKDDSGNTHILTEKVLNDFISNLIQRRHFEKSKQYSASDNGITSTYAGCEGGDIGEYVGLDDAMNSHIYTPKDDSGGGRVAETDLQRYKSMRDNDPRINGMFQK